MLVYSVYNQSTELHEYEQIESGKDGDGRKI